MAKLELNPLVKGISGAVGDELVCRQMPDGSTVMGKKPHFEDRIFSNGQLTHQSRFQEAASYARLAARTNSIYGEIARRMFKTAYNVALSDWFNPPVIRSIQRQDGRILVDARDNVLVTQVLVTILDEQGMTLEQGEAMLVNEAWWEYMPATEGKVRVEAWDLAGNVTRKDEG